MNFGLGEVAFGLACCGAPLLLIAGAGTVLTLVKLGVIGSYWLKGEEPVRDGGNYTLDQSQAVSNSTDETEA